MVTWLDQAKDTTYLLGVKNLISVNVCHPQFKSTWQVLLITRRHEAERMYRQFPGGRTSKWCALPLTL